MSKCKFKIDVFKEEFHLKADGAALHLAIQKGLIPKVFERIFAEAKISEQMEKVEIVENLRKLLREGEEKEEGLISRLARATAQEETKWIGERKFEDSYQSLGVTEALLQQVVEVHVTCMANNLRSQIVEIIETVNRE